MTQPYINRGNEDARRFSLKTDMDNPKVVCTEVCICWIGGWGVGHYKIVCRASANPRPAPNLFDKYTDDSEIHLLNKYLQ